MAVSSNPEVEDHYLTQAALVALLADELKSLWPILDLENLDGTLPEYKIEAGALVEQFGDAAISLSADHYEAMRDLARIKTPFRIPLVPPPAIRKVNGYIDAATQGMLDILTAEGDLIAAEFEAEIQASIDSALQALVMDAGRLEIITAADEDREAKGWARVVRPEACSFCLILAARGPIYKSRESASFKAHMRFDGKGGDCRCTPQPIFSDGADGFEASAQVRRATAIYDGLELPPNASPSDVRNAFRRAIYAERKAT